MGYQKFSQQKNQKTMSGPKRRVRRGSMMPLSRPNNFKHSASFTISDFDQRSETSSKSHSSSSYSSPPPAQNILVAVRVRPGLSSEEASIHEHLYDVAKEGPLKPDDKKLAYDTENHCVSGRKDYDVVPHTYSYDSLFGPNDGNPYVYEKAVKPVVDSVLEGYHATCVYYLLCAALHYVAFLFSLLLLVAPDLMTDESFAMKKIKNSNSSLSLLSSSLSSHFSLLTSHFSLLTSLPFSTVSLRTE